MDFNLNNNVNTTKALTQPQFKYNPPPEKEEAPKEKKKEESPVINGLSSLIAKAQTEKPEPEEDTIKNELMGIDSELSDIEAYVNEINSQGEMTMEEVGKILAVLKELQARLDELEKQIQELAEKYKLDDKAAAKQMGQMSQVDLLRRQIESQREQQEANAPKVDLVASVEAPKAV